MQPATRHLPGLDFLRAIAILIVFIWHYRQSGSPAWADAVGAFGWTGVDLFFVLSGYLIGGQLLAQVARGKGIAPGRFYARRFFRIIPAYAVVLVLYYVLPGFAEREGMPPLWRFLTFTQNFGLDLRTEGAFSHAWSLCIEEQFYVLLPFVLMAILALRLSKATPWLIFGLMLLGLALRIHNWNTYVEPFMNQDNPAVSPGIQNLKYIYYPSYTRMDGLLTGVSIAALFTFRPQFSEKLKAKGIWFFIGGLLLLTAAWFLCRDMHTFQAAVFGYPLVSLGYGCLVIAALSPSCFLYRLEFRPFSYLATLAYAVYLTHKQIIHLVKENLEPQGIAVDGELMLLLCAVASLLAGMLLHYAIERPFLKWRDKLVK